MKYFNVEGNFIEEEGLIAISSCLSNIGKLSIGKNLKQNCTEDGIIALVAIAKRLEEQVKE